MLRRQRLTRGFRRPRSRPAWRASARDDRPPLADDETPLRPAAKIAGCENRIPAPAPGTQQSVAAWRQPRPASTGVPPDSQRPGRARRVESRSMRRRRDARPLLPLCASHSRHSCRGPPRLQGQHATGRQKRLLLIGDHGWFRRSTGGEHPAMRSHRPESRCCSPGGQRSSRPAHAPESRRSASGIG